MPVVSIIVPNYNHSDYLNQRLDSILNQTYQDFELIILDDGSKDNSKEIIEQYRSHAKVSNIVFNEVNSGSTFKQWEKGIKLVKGEYVWIAESDDYADELFLESVMNIIKNNSKIGLVYCGSNLVNENGETVGELVRSVKNNCNGHYLNDGFKESRDAFFFHPIVPNASAVLFKTENFYFVNEQFKQYKICGDWQFWIDISFNSFIAYLPEKLNYFRQTNTSVSRSNFHRKNTYELFLVEKLKIALYIYNRMECKMPLFNKIRFIEEYLFIITLDFLRNRISFSKTDWLFIIKSLLYLSILAPFIFFSSLIRVVWMALSAVKRKFFSTAKFVFFFIIFSFGLSCAI